MITESCDFKEGEPEISILDTMHKLDDELKSHRGRAVGGEEAGNWGLARIFIQHAINYVNDAESARACGQGN